MPQPPTPHACSGPERCATDPPNLLRGIVIGVLLAVPLWAVIYGVVRMVWGFYS
jgi:hypothetical protein